MKKLSLIIIACLLLAACGKNAKTGTGSEGGDSKPALVVKIDGAVVPFEVKSSWQGQNSYTTYGSKPEVTTAIHDFAIRNYAYDKPNGSVIVSNEKLSTPGQVLVYIKLYGENGKSDQKTPVKVGTYSGGGTMNNTLERVLIYRYGDPNTDVTVLAFDSGTAGNVGSVKITAINGDTITGEIDASGKADGKDVSVKGPFTAKIYTPGM